MRPLPPFALSCIGLVLWCSAAAAQNLPEPLVSATRQAITTNPDVQARWNGFKAQQKQIDVARAARRPQVDLQASVGREQRRTPSTDFGTYPAQNIQLTLNQLLFDGGASGDNIQRQDLYTQQRYFELAQSAETVALEVVSAYIDVVRQQTLLKMATENYVEHKVTLDQINERVSAGVGRRVDLEQASGRVGQAESALNEQQGRMHNAVTRYQRAVGVYPPKQLPAWPEGRVLATMPGGIDSMMRDGLRQNPGLLASFQAIQAENEGIEARKAAMGPTANLQAFGSREKNADGQIGQHRTQYIELALRQNLYRGGADSAYLRQAEETTRQAEQNHLQTCRQVTQNLLTALNEVRKFDEQLPLLDQHRLSTDKARVAYRQQFDIGQRTLLDLLDVQSEFYQAASAYVDAQHNQLIAQARTLSEMGALVRTVGVARSDVPSTADLGVPTDLGERAAAACPTETVKALSLAEVKASLQLPQVAKPVKSYVTLLPNPDGSVGKVLVDTAGGRQELTQPMQAADLGGKASVFNVDKAQLERDFGGAMAANPGQPARYNLFFNKGSARLTPASAQELRKIVADASKRPALEVVLIGHADTLSSTKVNDALALKRAQTVAQALGRAGLKFARLEVSAVGERDLLVATPDETSEARNRRVLVTLQ